jgi:hypothetical protein
MSNGFTTSFVGGCIIVSYAVGIQVGNTTPQGHLAGLGPLVAAGVGLLIITAAAFYEIGRMRP